MNSLRERLAPHAAATLALFGVLALFGLTYGVTHAHENPTGCSDSGVGISLSIFRNDGVTPITGGNMIAVGETIKYRATLTALGLPNCSFSGGTLTITTPASTTDVSGGVIPLVSTSSPFVSAFVNYTVQAADIGGDNDIDASTNYTGGISHTGESHDSAAGSVTRQTVVSANIIVDKVTNPAGDPQSFNFIATGSGYSNFSLTDSAAPNNQTLAPGTYGISETLPAGWTQGSTTCISSLDSSGGENPAAINLTGGETVTCTFNNTKTVTPPPPSGEYCSPGYWKQSQHFDSWVTYSPNQQFSSVFENAFPGKTLVQVLAQGGGGLNALGRATVGALLNGSSMNAAFTSAEVIAAFNGAFPGSKDDYNDLKASFEVPENCPLN